ncbi:neutral/alkaline ceramidase [Nocardioides luteus]|uniref:Neutral ceramidase n=1 Tax=Nocardioides luteus TaxID=1844 RepID=A0A1J4N8J9_9ACTN|nr:neutral/alkaline ceramidase [Nocardioides luteus]OIJ27287.1 alkaline ceramidase [Nocardioides luteus]
MTWVTWRTATATAAVTVAALGLAAAPPSASGATTVPSSTARATTDRGEDFLVGRGIADVTGEVAETGMMGYADISQVSSGLHMRQRARAFVIADPESGERVVHVLADAGMIFQSVRDAVLAKLEQRYGDTYTERNVMLTATHTHSAPGGFSHHTLYNITTLGYHGKTFRALVDGIVSSIERADADLAPAELSLSTSELTNANVNRSKTAFDRNPEADKAYFPGGVDTRSTTLQVHRGGDLDGVINWFPVHATSMSTNNTLVSPDNKGYAEYAWERLASGVDYVEDSDDPDVVASFAQTNSGDMSPNLNLHPSDGPTTDQFENTRIIGTRTYDAARRGLDDDRTLTGGVDSRIVYVDLANTAVRPEFTPDGKPHTTCPAALGAAFAAGSTEDGGGGLPIFKEGKDGGNPAVAAISEALYTASPALRACQGSKEILLPVGPLDMVQQKLPVQLVRIGDLYLVGMPAEVTVVSGLRLRQAVAEAVGTDIDHVLVQGYANAYAHYLTTPEEYDAKEYEGASTLFGRYELPAFMQTAADLGAAMRDGVDVPLGEKERDRSAEQFPSLQGAVVADAPPLGKAYGDVLTAPGATYRPGEQVSVTFAGAHPNNDLKHGGSYLTVEQSTPDGWRRIADDGDWSTKFHWERYGIAASKVTIAWDVPDDVEPGSYRIRYFGDARSLLGSVRSISGTSPTFSVVGR